MKFEFYAAAMITMAAVCTSKATITLEYDFRSALRADGTPIPAGSLWALVVDNGNDTFAGFNLNESLYNEPANTADTYFVKDVTSISLGATIGGGTVFAMGGFNSAGTAQGELAELTLGVNGLAANEDVAFYWFPDVAYTSPGTYVVESEVGGLHSSRTEGDVLYFGMRIPTDGDAEIIGAISLSTTEGTTPNNDFRAVTLVPEPSTALLGAFGALALLRRRRVVQD